MEDITCNLKVSFDVSTTINGDEIHQVISCTNSQISNQVYKTAEESFRNALITLGWTPPKEK